MNSFRKTLGLLTMLAAPLVGGAACARAQIGLPPTAVTAGRDTTIAQSPIAQPPIAQPLVVEAPLVLKANVRARVLVVQRGDTTLKTYAIAVGQNRYPTPTGTFKIRKMIWNPSWRPPPNSDWARGKKAKGPGEPGNPMKVVKIFFREPTYYIHGTGEVGSLGEAASHGCIRMDPDEVADLARIIMEHGGQPREENWFWRIIHSRREEKVIYLDNPIALTIS